MQLEFYTNCKIFKAEAWLKEQAQAMGWSKAVKLEGRSTTQGLVGIVVKNNIGAMVEVNCETDFVARNEKFQKFVEMVSVACAEYVKDVDSKENITKVALEADALKNLKTEDGKSLGDHLALVIGNVGENASFKRAICFKSSEGVCISGHIHPSSEPLEDGRILTGKYGALAAFNSNSNSSEMSEDTRALYRNICQHIVGMKPLQIGDAEVDKPAEDKDDETRLIFQEYILDPDITVGEVLAEKNVKIIDFQRFECGEK